MSEKFEVSAERAVVEAGKRYVTKCGTVIGPVETIDVNRWAWFRGRCWNADGGAYYAVGPSPHDIIGVVEDVAA